LVLGLAIALMSFAAAAPIVGGVVTKGPSERGSDTTSGTATLEGGNVTMVNVSGTQITSRWGGFYGFISGGIQLSDGTNNFYVWTISNFTGGVVYAVNSTVASWTLSPINHSVAPYDVTTVASDNYNHTFGTTATFTAPSMTVNNVPYTTTYQNGAMGTLRTYGLIVTTSPNTNVWAGMIQTNASSFKGGGALVDYQILAPARTIGTVYNFYLEMP
jgi:hypothetical protein